MPRELANVRTDAEDRIRLEAFIADCAARFTAALAPEDLDRELERGLRELLDVLQADRCALIGGNPCDGPAWLTTEACGDGIDNPFAGVNFAASFPWIFRRSCGQRQPIAVARLAELPPEAERDRQSAMAMGVRSFLMLPVPGHEANPHCLMLQAVREERAWPAAWIERLQMLAGVFVNALERKVADETRQQIETRHGDLLKLASAILWRGDPRTFQTTFVSKEAETILGYPVESWLKVPNFWRDHIHPDDRAWVVAFSAKATEQHRKHDFEYRMVVADGRVVWLRNIVNVLVEKGQPTELVGVTVDVTERKRAEFETAHLRHELAHAGRVTMLGELAATLAHELNQPLGAIVSNAETARLLVNAVPRAADDLRLILDDIVQDGHRAGEIVHHARLLLQKKVVEAGPLDVRSLVDGVVELTRSLTLARHIVLTVEVAPGLPDACGDAVQIQQVLLNLILNAMEALADTAPNVRHIVIRAALHGAASIELSVADSGSGIPEERLPHVFDHFFTTKSTGMGMGLAICRTIVRAHGGDIRAENNPDGGATVRFTLPLYDRSGEAGG